MTPVKNSSRYSAFTSAVSFLKSLFDEKTVRPDGPLPSVRRLAENAGVSKTTMARALGELVRNKSITLPAPKPAAAGSASLTRILPPGLHKRDLVEQDIITGRFGLAGRLPLIKELQSRYGVCFRTMRRILRELEKDGIVRSSGKGYVLPGASAGKFRQQIIFITCAGHYSQGSAINHEHNRIINLFENECMRLGIHVRIVEIDFYNSTECRRAVTELKNSGDLIGVILDVWWYDPEDYRRGYLDVLERLASFNKPVAILDEVANFELPLHLTANARIQVYRIEGKKAGERMARYLISQGHTSVAFISSIHQADWSRERYNGVLSQFARAGLGKNVHLYADDYHLSLEYLLAGSGLADDDVRSIIAAGRTVSQAKDLEGKWMAFKKNMPGQLTGDVRFDRQLRSTMAAVANIMHANLDKTVLGKMSDATLSAVGSQMFDKSLEPLFDKALEKGDSTAWICATDGSALCALSYLRNHGLNVPKDMSVAGFDNIPVSAIEQHLTTYDFNALGFINRMLNFIVRPPKPRGPYRHSVIEVEGTVMQRETVAPPRKA